MDIFTVTVVIMIMVFAMVFVSVRHFRRHEIPDGKLRFVPLLMIVCILVVTADVFAGDGFVIRLPSDLMLSLSMMFLLTSSMWEYDDALRAIVCVVVVQIVWLIYYVMVAAGVLSLLSVDWSVRMSGIGAVFISLMFLVAIHLRVREVRLVMSHGNVWSSLSMMVDIVYVISALIYAFVLLLGMSLGLVFGRVISHVVSVLLALEFGAMGVRIATESVFVVCSRHERRIVESMKISPVEVLSDTSKVEEAYRGIYERVVQLFETDRMYLNSELTINDIVKIVYTNKLYISRAISQFTGRNFCQFVNYYRVIHSIRLFRENPELKVAELANQSGFNSSVTFGMAFRLYMSESPSEWCRKEKYKIARKKK